MMVWIWIIAVCVILLVGEAAFIMPDKMPWNKGKKDKHGKR